MSIRYSRTTRGVNWEQIRAMYRVSEFDNGRGTEMLRRCFERSQAVCFAFDGKTLVGTARAISDQTSCAAVFDVCVHPDYRNAGIGRAMVGDLLARLNGQFVILTTTLPDFYKPFGFRVEARAMAMQVGVRAAPENEDS